MHLHSFKASPFDDRMNACTQWSLFIETFLHHVLICLNAHESIVPLNLFIKFFCSFSSLFALFNLYNLAMSMIAIFMWIVILRMEHSIKPQKYAKG